MEPTQKPRPRLPRAARSRICADLDRLCRDLDAAAAAHPLPPTLVDRCAWWLPFLCRRRAAPWPSIQAAILRRLQRHLGLAVWLDPAGQLFRGRSYRLWLYPRAGGFDWYLGRPHRPA